MSGLFGGGRSSGRAQARAIIRAAQIQAEQEKLNRELRREIYEENKALQAPWVAFSKWGLETLDKGMSDGIFEDPVFSEEAFRKRFEANKDPGYEFEKEELRKLHRRQASFSGYSEGGATATQNMATSVGRLARGAYNQAYGRAIQQHMLDRESKRMNYNRLASIAGVGQIGPLSQLQLSNQYANDISQINRNIGQIQGNALVGAANARAAGEQQGFNNIMAVTGLVGGLTLGGLGVWSQWPRTAAGGG